MYPKMFFGYSMVSSYWILVGIGIIAGFMAIIINTRNEPQKMKKLLLLGLLLFIPFFLGAGITIIYNKLFFPETACGRFSGFSLWPGIIAACAAAFPLCRILKIDIWEAADIFSLSVSIGGFFAKTGCLFNGCCFGKVCSDDYFLATLFSVYSAAGSMFPDIPLHPVQLYSALSWLFIFIFLNFKKKNFNGQQITTAGILFAVFNFIIEYFRYHPLERFISNSQIFSLIILAVSVFLFYNRKKHQSIRF